MDNLWITWNLANRQLAEAERERGGGCIIGVLENDIDSQLQIHKESGLLVLVNDTSNSPQNRLQGA